MIPYVYIKRGAYSLGFTRFPRTWREIKGIVLFGYFRGLRYAASRLAKRAAQRGA